MLDLPETRAVVPGDARLSGYSETRPIAAVIFWGVFAIMFAVSIWMLLTPDSLTVSLSRAQARWLMSVAPYIKAVAAIGIGIVFGWVIVQSTISIRDWLRHR